MGIRICPDCGGKVSDSRRDCIHCGYVFPVTKQCPDCGGNIEENAKVCPECGYPFEVEQTTGVATASVAPTVQIKESKAKQTSKLDETTSVVCPQCGSNDIELKSSELGKCRACGTTVVLPKKEQQVNVVNNFVVNNNAENSAQYYTIKRERTLNDEFIREAYVAMTQDRKTPIDISDGEFVIVKESNEQYIEVDSTANITYSATVGYDYKVTYTDYDSQGKPVQRTKTETEWKPFSGSHVTQSTVYVGNDDNSKRASAFGRAVNHAEPGSIMPYDGTDTTEAAPLTPNPASIERAKQNAIFEAESEAERSLPGDRYKDFNASGSATVNSVKSYSAPTQDALFKYKEEEHFCTAFAFGPFMLGGTSPDDSDSIHQVVKEKTNPLFITSLSLLGVLIALIVVAFTCPVGFNGALLSILVPACVMLAMLIASIAVTKSLYTKLINKQQQVKVERTDEKLSELKLAPMTDAEKTTATSKAGESSLTHKKNPLRIATIALCIIFFIGSIVSVFVANNLNIEGYFDNLYGNSVVCLHSYDHDCDTTCNECGAIREIEHTYANNCDASCNICGATRAPSNHVYTNTCDKTCNECGAIREIEHTYANNCDASCNICGATRTPSNHVYTDTCDTTCNECGAVRTIEHTYSSGCDTICNVCGATRTTSIAHPDVNPADNSCDNCGASVSTLTFTLSGDGQSYAITDANSSISGGITLPSTYNGKPVTTIGNYAFLYCTSLTSVTIPDSVTTIGEGAFYGCSSLTSIVIPDRVTSIGDHAFAGCTGLKDVYYTGDIAGWCGISFGNVYANPMYHADNLYIGGKLVEDLAIPDSVTTIGNFAFWGCTRLTSVTIGGSVTSIGDYAFERCTSLTSVTFGENSQLTTIGSYAFVGCDSLASIAIPDGVTRIDNHALAHCDSLTSVTFGENSKLTTIGEDAFYSCDSLTSITIPDSVTSIGDGAFYNCNSLTSVTIGDSVTSIGLYAFSGCSKLVEVYNKSSLNIVAGSSDYGYVGHYARNVYTEEGGSKLTTDENGYIIYTDGDDKILVGYVGKQTDLIIPDGIKKIYIYAFYNCSSLTSVTIGDSVSSISDYAFYDCTSLTSVTFGENSQLTTIGSSAFGDCDSLTSITIPDSVTSIGWYAFAYCDSLTSVTFGANSQLTAIDNYAFHECTSLTSISVDENNPNYKSINGNLYSKDGKTLIQYAIGKTATSFIIPDSVITIGDGAFAYCYSLTSVTIGDSVTRIGERAFYDCDSLTSVTFGDNSQLTTIGDDAFYDCTSLTSITIPISVTTIGEYAFSGCRSLTDAYYTGDIAGWCGISFGSASANPMYYANNLYIDGKLVEGELIIPDSVTSIGSYAFYNCTCLTSVTIGDSVTSIGERAFYCCSSLTSVYYTGTEEEWNSIAIGSDNYPLTNATIHYNYVADEN